MTNIGDIHKDGFSLSTGNWQLTDVAPLSLRIGLKAYFSTYRSMKGRLSWLDSTIEGSSQEENKAHIDHSHHLEYCEAYSEAILHFHHFIELTIKELLRREHPLLATDAQERHTILHKMLKNKKIGTSEQEGLNSPEFGKAAERLCALVSNSQIANYRRLKFIVEAKPWLDKLNNLRNRLVHRGTYMLRYKALDRLTGEYIFPFVQKALKLPIYSGSKFNWRYRKLHCRIDPITRIAREASSVRPDFHRIALLKELGRAAYENPLKYGLLRKQRGTRIIDGVEQDAEKLAKTEKGGSNSDAIEVRACPVCGVKALVIYGTIRSDSYFDEETGEVYTDREEFYTYAVKCLCCSFEIEDELGESCFVGLPFTSYWRTEELTPISQQ